MFRRALVVLVLAALAAPAGARADAYYGSPGGSDGHAGTSPASAWKTLAKVDARSFDAGDRVLFECGGTFAGQLRVRSSGTRARPLEFGWYGSSCNASN